MQEPLLPFLHREIGADTSGLVRNEEVVEGEEADENSRGEEFPVGETWGHGCPRVEV